jgi:large subunit ribosomal protein L24
MKSKFSTSWKSSKLPRKQRKYRANALLHTKHKFLNAHLSKSLREKYGKRSLPLRKGDDVLIMRGSFKKKKAKVDSVNVKNSILTLSGIQRTKKDGTKVAVKFSPSSLQIQELSLDDSKRINAIKKGKEQSQPKYDKRKDVSKKTPNNN